MEKLLDSTIDCSFRSMSVHGKEIYIFVNFTKLNRIDDAAI